MSQISLNKKKILILSSGGADQMNTSFSRAFMSLGHNADIYFDDTPSIRLLLMKFYNQIGLESSAINEYQKFKKANESKYDHFIKKFNPNLILMIGFNSITSRLIKKITNEYNIPTAYFVIADPLVVDPINSFYLDHLIECSHLLFMCPESIPVMKLVSQAKMTPIVFPGDPNYFKPIGVDRDLDISIVGQFSSLSTSTITKAYILNSLCAAGLRVSAAGNGIKKIFNRKEFPHLNKLKIIKDATLSNQEVNEIYNRSKIVIATGHPRDKGALHPRVVEGALAKTFVLADAPESVREYFGDSVASFRTITDLVNQARYYLSSSEERIEKAGRAYQIALKNYTYQSSASKILSFVFGQ